MNGNRVSRRRSSCRALLKAVPVAGFAVPIGATDRRDVVVAQTKLSHAHAKYRDTPKGGQQCVTRAGPTSKSC
jgi:hypothetical protein